MTRIIVRHISGRREGQLDQFPVGEYDLLVGRDPVAQVRYDAEGEDLVSRQHAKIARDPWDPAAYQLVDLQSRNGTFLNRQRVYGSVRLNHHDVIQLGAGGPQFRFELDPPPAAGATRVLDDSPLGLTENEAAVKPTRESWMPDPEGRPQPVGRATMERMLGDVFTRVRTRSNRTLWLIGIGATLGILLLGFGTYRLLRRSQTELQSNITQAQARNDATIAQVQEELKKNPEALEEAKRQVSQLEDQLRQSNSKNEANYRALMEELRAARQQTAAIARRMAQAEAVKVSDRSSGGYEALLAEAESRLADGKPAEALRLVTQATASNAQRWEAYALHGRIAAAMNQTDLAVEAYSQALARAPGPAKANIEAELKALGERANRRP